MVKKIISNQKRKVEENASASTSDSGKQLTTASSSKRIKSDIASSPSRRSKRLSPGKEIEIWTGKEPKKKTTKKTTKKDKSKKGKELAVEKEEKTGCSRSLVFRCSFASMKNMMEKIKNKLSPEHISIMAGTPFNNIFNMFYENKVQVTKVNNKDIKKALFALLDCYSKDDVGFIISENLIKFQVEDVALLLGLKAYGEDIVKKTSHDKHKDSTLMKKYFDGHRNIYKDQISDKIEELLEEENHIKDDVVLLIITYICITIFFNNSANRLMWSHTPYFDDLIRMNNVNWAAGVHSFLVDKLNENYRRKMLPEENKDYQETNCVMGGCTIILLYWLCENTDIISKIKGFEDVCPRVGRWNLEDVVKKCIESSTNKFIDLEVVPSQSEWTTQELELIQPTWGEAEALS